jgi:prepilin-type N-terminal cleavage/methylation domain-containing protein
VRRERSGMTMIEILVVVSIIAVLIGILIPALSMVQNTAREVKQKAQFTAIDLGLAAFRNDYGDYPPSDWTRQTADTPGYCGAQKLAEALLGWDLLGFHPDSAWRGDGLAPDPVTGRGLAGTVYFAPDTLTRRKDRYIELETANAFPLCQRSGMRDGLFVDTSGAPPLAPRAYVLCDVFQVPERKLLLDDGRSVVPGTPILYYRANTSSKSIDRGYGETIDAGNPFKYLIYNRNDNDPLLFLRRLADAALPWAARRIHPLDLDAPPGTFVDFYSYIRDPKVPLPRLWPYRPDSYILISAGRDGLYGTPDDICNFGRR